MRVSIITAVYNRVSSIAGTIQSVLSQQGTDIEYIVVDGNSDDGTEEIIRSFEDRIDSYIREPDTGIYNALNKGIRAATGDIVGFVHADDVLSDTTTIQRIGSVFEDAEIDAVYGDLVYVQNFSPEKVVRYWKSRKLEPQLFRWGWMPPHPTFYLRRRHYMELGFYREDFSISSDYELMLRMLYRHRLNAAYVDSVLVRMKLGGISNGSIFDRLWANSEDKLAWKVNALPPPAGLRLIKPLRKLGQYYSRQRSQ
jgi:glycosyltransferase involved in cell wall biosynthesis